MLARSEAVRLEMSSAVRFLGQDGATAKEAVNIAARKAKLPTRLVERLRYRKIVRVAADVADAIREAVAAHQQKQEAAARHEIAILTARLQALETRFQTTDPDFHCFDIAPSLEPIGLAGADDRSGTAGAAARLNSRGRA